MRGAVFCLVITAARLSFAQDVVSIQDAPVYAQIEGGEVSQAGNKFNVGPGLYLNEAAAKETAKIIVSLQEQNKKLSATVEEQSALIVPTWVFVAVGVVAFGAGAGASLLLRK